LSISRAATAAVLPIRQPKRDTARLGLVRDVGRQDLEGDRRADFVDRRCHASHIGHGQRLRHRYAERGKQRGRTTLVEA
jgi:hypothetical protein